MQLARLTIDGQRREPVDRQARLGISFRAIGFDEPHPTIPISDLFWRQILDHSGRRN